MLFPTYYSFIDSLGGLSCIRHERDQDRRKEKKWLFSIISSTEEGKSSATLLVKKITFSTLLPCHDMPRAWSLYMN